MDVRTTWVWILFAAFALMSSGQKTYQKKDKIMFDFDSNNKNGKWLTVDDVVSFENEHGRIQPGTIVLMRTDWSKRWPDKLEYLGDDTPGDVSNLHFPGLSAESARLLANERQVGAIGVDVASIDTRDGKRGDGSGSCQWDEPPYRRCARA